MKLDFALRDSAGQNPVKAIPPLATKFMRTARSFAGRFYFLGR
jgi:hypothetical protein